MRIFALDESIDEPLASSLDAFEHEFSYPLGNAGTLQNQPWRGLHPVLPRNGRGAMLCCGKRWPGHRLTCCGAFRKICYPDLSERTVGYIGDLKIAETARSGRALFRLAGEAMAWNRQRAVQYFGTVMDGTTATPDSYSGRAGLPRFQALAKVAVLGISTSGTLGEP